MSTDVPTPPDDYPAKNKEKKLWAIILTMTVIIIVMFATLLATGVIQLGTPTNNQNGDNTPATTQQYGSILVTLSDTETNKPIGKVGNGYVRILIDGIDQGYLADDGTIRVNNVAIGNKELTLIIPDYGEKRQNIVVSANEETNAQIEVNMPNPVFQIGIDLEPVNYWVFWEYGNIKVSLGNFGDIDSVSTSVLVLVYREDQPSTLISSHIFDFPSLVPHKRGGQTVDSDNWKCDNFIVGVREVAVAVVFDGYEYTPQNEQILCSVTASESLITEVGSSVLKYLADNPQYVIDTIAQICISAIA